MADSAIDKLKVTIRELTRRTRGHRLADIVQELKTALTGWKAYFGIAEVLSPLREIDKWVRRRLRCYAWKQWGQRGLPRTQKKRGQRARGLEHKQERVAHGG
ncbi:MAG: group II intron maturase-specific domain-containing protein [Nitrospiraceae bacterium]